MLQSCIIQVCRAIKSNNNCQLLQLQLCMVLLFIIIWLGVISSNMDNSALGNNKNYLPLLSNIIAGRKPILLVIFPRAHKCFHLVLTNQLQAYMWGQLLFSLWSISVFIRYWPISCKLTSEHVMYVLNSNNSF